MIRVPVVALSLVTAAFLMVGVKCLILCGDPRAELERARAESTGAAASSEMEAPLDVVIAHRELMGNGGELVGETTAPPLPKRSRTPVRVHGQVFGGCGPVADYNLSFCITGDSTTNEVDWGFTDEEGRYEVELRTGLYEVYDTEGLQVSTFEVTEGSEVLLLDLYVPA